MRNRVAAVIGAVAALVLVACSGDSGDLPEVPDFTPASTTTTGIDYSDVPLKGVPGRAPTTTVAFGPGQATISGTVIGEEGAVAGATVHVERIVSGVVGITTVVSAEDGTWTLPQIFGGRYRVRAWRTPDLAQTSWTALFLGSSETKAVQLRVRSVGGLNLSSSIAPDPPQLGEQANLVVQITLKVVDDKGIVRATPQDNISVELVHSGGWRIETANPAITDANGRVAWTLRCRGTGRHPLAVTVGTQTVPLEVANCVDVTEETTTTTAEAGLVP